MVDFRYHLVSIIAVFLALAIGIVVGTTALNGYVVDDLRKRNRAVIHDKRSLEGSVRDLRTQVSRRDDFAATVAPEVVAGQLTGQRQQHPVPQCHLRSSCPGWQQRPQQSPQPRGRGRCHRG